MSTNVQGAYYEGQKAFREGLTEEDNPYDEGSLQYSEWLCGYIDAKAIESG